MKIPQEKNYYSQNITKKRGLRLHHIPLEISFNSEGSFPVCVLPDLAISLLYKLKLWGLRLNELEKNKASQRNFQ